MERSPTFSLNRLRLPLYSESEKRAKKRSQGNGSWTPPYLRRVSSLSVFLAAKGWPVWRILKYWLVLVTVILFLFYRTYKVHIEIQLFNRGWLTQNIVDTHSLSDFCFAEDYITHHTEYNLTRARAPRYVDVHAGMNMPHGMDCYNFAASLPRSPVPGMVLPEHTIIHTYWRADLLPLTQRQIDLFHSILATQDALSTSVILWTNTAVGPDVELSKAAHLMLETLKPIQETYGSRFEVREIDTAQLIKQTPLEKRSDRVLQNTNDKKAWVDGDLVRILVLYVHGGLWIDMDTLLTGRDLRVLLESEWVTQWDCYDKPNQPLNGAMMHFFRHSPYLCEMMHVISTDTPPRPHSTDWGSLLYHKVWRALVQKSITPFKILPYCLTDPYSCKLDTRIPDPFIDFINKNDNLLQDESFDTIDHRLYLIQTKSQLRISQLKHKVNSVFAVHLHNQWHKQFPPNGWVQRLILDKIYKAVEAYKQSTQ